MMDKLVCKSVSSGATPVNGARRLAATIIMAKNKNNGKPEEVADDDGEVCIMSRAVKFSGAVFYGYVRRMQLLIVYLFVLSVQSETLSVTRLSFQAIKKAPNIVGAFDLAK